MPSSIIFLFQFFGVRIVETFNIFPIVKSHFFHRIDIPSFLDPLNVSKQKKLLPLAMHAAQCGHETYRFHESFFHKSFLLALTFKLYGIGMTIIRECKCFVLFIEMNDRYSVSFVWATISSSALINANLPALKFPSCVNDNQMP